MKLSALKVICFSVGVTIHKTQLEQDTFRSVVIFIRVFGSNSANDIGCRFQNFGEYALSSKLYTQLFSPSSIAENSKKKRRQKC